MRTLTAFAALLLAAAPLRAQADKAHHDTAMGHDHDPDKAVSGGGGLPAGWSARPDAKGNVANVKFVPMGSGMHVTLGPATILYRTADKVSGPFHTVATFTQTKAPAHPEGYGLFVGGKTLAGPGQQYTYFLVRGDGTYLIKQRNGDKTTDVSKGWTAHPAIHKADKSGKATNKLEIDEKTKAGALRFLANGQVVYEGDAKTMDTNGIAGLRVNHNLDVHIDGFGVHRL